MKISLRSHSHTHQAGIRTELRRRHRIEVALSAIWIGVTFQACGLVLDAVRFVQGPTLPHEVGAICRQGHIDVGVGIEPRRPFVFPAIWTDEGARVTGFDIELTQVLATALTNHCGKPVIPVLHVIRFRDLFLSLDEGHLDMFVSAVSANALSLTAAGVGYSFPYFQNAGIAVITRQAEVVDRVRENLRQLKAVPNRPVTYGAALAGLTVAVQEGTSFHWYAAANLQGSRLVLCDSLPAAFEADGLPIDVIVGGMPVLNYMVTRVRTGWQFVTTETGQPLILLRENYSIVTEEQSYGLRWLINNLLFQLEESGRLAEMRRRWLEEVYAFPRRAETEGLPFKMDQMVEHYNQGQCRWGTPP